MSLHLVIGNKNYSSWSFRPWLALTVAGIPFEETVVSLGDPDFKATVSAHSGTGKVPVLIDGDVRVWESLAIIEYVADQHRKRASGRPTGWRARTRGRSRPRCMPASRRSARRCR